MDEMVLSEALDCLPSHPRICGLFYYPAVEVLSHPLKGHQEALERAIHAGLHNGASRTREAAAFIRKVLPTAKTLAAIYYAAAIEFVTRACLEKEDVPEIREALEYAEALKSGAEFSPKYIPSLRYVITHALCMDRLEPEFEVDERTGDIYDRMCCEMQCPVFVAADIVRSHYDVLRRLEAEEEEV